MIRFESVSVTYDGADTPALAGVDLHVPEGELCLVAGTTGSGKSSLLRCVNGLVPHFSGGRLDGRVTVAGRDTRTHPPRELADVVGVVGQDVRAGFVADMVEDELAYGMESIGLSPDVMRRRVEETLDLLGLTALRHRSLITLSGGEAQRVAIGAVLTMHPRVLVLDEPTSALDPTAAEEVLAALHRLVHDSGLTVLLAEHRLERVVQYADRVVHLAGPGEPIVAGPVGSVLAESQVAPPVVQLARLAGWQPVPVSVRDARRAATSLTRKLTGLEPQRVITTDATAPIAAAIGLTIAHDGVTALHRIDLAVRPSEIVAVMGRNGAGKSSLLGAFAGLHAPSSGRVTVGGIAPHECTGREVVRNVGLVPQDAGDLLYADTIADECTQADHDAELPPGATARMLEAVLTGLDPQRHPRDLSEGERLALALAVVLAPHPPVIALDEPTRGLDYAAKARLATVLREAATDGHAVLLATHDVELAAEIATRVVILADGDIVADGPAHDVLVSAPAFAPQVAKVLAPLRFLTVSEVRAALADLAPTA